MGSLYCISALAPGATFQDRIVAPSILLFGLILGLSWMRARKRIRNMERKMRTLRKGLRRIGLRGRLHERRPPRPQTLTLQSIGYRRHSAGD
jgi:hypothetical protein